ncbi:hypothetical protein M409DRAFT_16401 [Zasmidium cellare ATCC 36951]|uniref:DNA replication regulator SLD2 n=1 Tax=Zasmidium cellare ATCC 36951 TaxID=1080233 RepID=A0A6A6D3Z0_ZASCE|nr:uncharacterized protein M409DRAFT_16401 [Zasmidium cellare ATCC 36951]KAF2174131.1 hypothetical protein M409DRAFT_16401 [Zasmidium cellare ATCC 36951]
MSADEGRENHVNTDTLRTELKSWENAFKAKNGRKPGRADIKNDATIAAKYKLYDRVTRREQTTPKQTPRKSHRSRPKEDFGREEAAHRTSTTPRKSPSKKDSQSLPPLQPSPFAEIEETPAHIRLALGPTPLKDGQVLGLFDFPCATPSRDLNTQKSEVENLVAGTPSKQTPASSEHAFSKTPQSVGRRFFLDAFAGTPLKRKREEQDIGTTSAKRLNSNTPAFLKRSFPMASIDEEGAEPPAARHPFKKRGLVRSLSSIIQGLKKQEDERMDEEWDILRDIEEEQEDGGADKRKEISKVMVQDSQAAEMPLGPDQAPLSDVEEAGEKETERKPWKKKGLKRQTRRVNMKPVLHRAKKADEVDEFDASEAEIVPETQVAEQTKEGADDGDGSESDFNEGEKRTTAKSKPTAKKPPTKEKDKEGKEASKKKPRKVNPDAHANFRKLNIKNKNSKANGRGKRFGRR